VVAIINFSLYSCSYFQDYDMYKERRMAAERGFMRRQKPRLADRQYNTPDQCGSDLRNEHTAAVQSTTNQLPVKQHDSLEDFESSKIDYSKGSFPPLPVVKQPLLSTATKAQVSQDTPYSSSIDGSRKNPIEKERPQSRGTALPRCGEGNLPAASYHQLNEQVTENIEFGSMGPFSLALASAKFDEAFPPLPSVKKPAAAPPQVGERHEPVVATNNR
jgi:hypothetical protein